VVNIQTIQKVIEAYGVYAINIYPVTDRVYWINDGKREYALKRSSLTEQTIVSFQKVLRFANERQLAAVLPVFLTKEREIFVDIDDTIYYLSPWVNHSNQSVTEQSIHTFYQKLGSIHSNTKQSEEIAGETLRDKFQPFQTFCHHANYILLDEVRNFEKERFMSPFELLVCTQYRDIEAAFTECTKRMDQFLQIKEAKLTWNTSLNHGNLRLSHWLDPYIINWEQAHYDNPVLDLMRFFLHETADYNHPSKLYMDAFSSYMKEYQLTRLELQLLSIYLLNPREYLSAIKDYHARTFSITSQIKRLQKAYRNLMFGLAWSHFVENEYETSFGDTEN